MYVAVCECPTYIETSHGFFHVNLSSSQYLLLYSLKVCRHNNAVNSVLGGFGAQCARYIREVSTAKQQGPHHYACGHTPLSARLHTCTLTCSVGSHISPPFEGVSCESNTALCPYTPPRGCPDISRLSSQTWAPWSCCGSTAPPPSSVLP